MKTYIGIRDLDHDRCAVTVDGQPLDPRLDLHVHEPDGFEWGYWGAGPAQLALAILADATGDGGLAVELHQMFKVRIVATLGGEWRMTDAIVLDWVDRNRASKSSPATADAVA